MGTQANELSLPDLIQESQRIREAFNHNVIKLRVTMERTRNVFAESGWPETSDVPASPKAEALPNQVLAGLTAREIEVLRLIAEGKSSKEIAVQLGIAFRTAVCHRYRIFQKLNVHETASVVRIAVRAGLVQP